MFILFLFSEETKLNFILGLQMNRDILSLSSRFIKLVRGSARLVQSSTQYNSSALLLYTTYFEKTFSDWRVHDPKNFSLRFWGAQFLLMTQTHTHAHIPVFVSFIYIGIDWNHDRLYIFNGQKERSQNYKEPVRLNLNKQQEDRSGNIKPYVCCPLSF